MSIAGARWLPGDSPPHPGYGGCTCSCHRMPNVFHCVPCCYPGKEDWGEPVCRMPPDSVGWPGLTQEWVTKVTSEDDGFPGYNGPIDVEKALQSLEDAIRPDAVNKEVD